LSCRRIDSSIRVRNLSPIFKSTGANQQRTPFPRRSAYSRSAKGWSSVE
jgi:hypothetical protein